MSPYMILNIVI